MHNWKCISLEIIPFEETMSRRMSLLRVCSPFPQATDTYVLIPFSGPGAGGSVSADPWKKNSDVMMTWGAAAGGQAGLSLGKRCTAGEGHTRGRQPLQGSVEGTFRSKAKPGDVGMVEDWEFRKSKVQSQEAEEKGPYA